MIAGSLEIQLLANMARLQSDMDAAKRSVGGAMGEIDKMAGMAKTALGALGAGLSAGALASFVKGAIDAADNLSDMSQKTGVAVETLGGLGFAASQAGGSLESIGAAAGKLNKSIAESVSGSNDQAAAFMALGIKVQDSSGKLKTADVVMAELADKFAQYSDGPEKAAIAVALFGKAGADMIPMLNDGGDSLRENIEYSKQYSNATTELSLAADDFNDTLGKLKVQQTGFANAITADVLPALTGMAKELLAAREGADGLLDTISRYFSISGAQASEPATALADIEKKLDSLKKTAGELETLSPFKKWLEGEDIAIVNAQIARLETQKDMLSKLSAGAQPLIPDGYGYDPYGDATSQKPAAPRLPGAMSKSAGETAYESFVADAAKREALLSAEAGGVAKLTDAEKWALETMVKVRDGKLGQSDAERALIGDRTAAVLALDKLNVAEAQRQQQVAAMLAEIDAQASITKGYEDGNKALREQTAEMGLTAEALATLKQARIDDAIALEQARIAGMASASQDSAEATAIRETIAALQDSKTALAENESAQRAADAVKAQGDVWRSIDDTAKQTFVSIWDGGKSTFDRLEETLKNGLYDLLYQMTIKKWMVQIATSVSGTAAAESAFGTAATSGLEAILSGLFGSVASGTGAGSAAVGSLWGAMVSGALATGGPVSAGSTYLVGEEGPELFTSGSNGYVTPNSALGGTNVTVNVVNNANGTKATQSERSDGNGGKIIDVMIETVKSAVAQDIGSGGVVAGAMESQYGLNRAAGAWR